ncbi:MAG: acetylglutamate kinase [Gemmatimonadetes bacterium 13_1_40CM_70_15]|nr:MAG: acetylglutamate kinase [Gemmatimonadetes bacterium 13_1_40CM_70_15]
MNVRVVKLGGNELERSDWLAACGRALMAVGHVVVVHGGGRAVTALSQRLGLLAEKRAGVRVTTPEIAEVVEMVLAGPINRTVVGALRQAGLDAVGLSGVDGGLLTAEQLPGGFGHVGRITGVRAALLHSLLLSGLTPVIAPMAPGGGAGGGLPLNVNADDAAAATAGALQAAELLFVSDVPGVVVKGVPQPSLPVGELDTLIELGIAANGMAAKLRAAAAALEAGARAVRIGDLRLLSDPTAGTRILATTPQPA